MRFLTQTFQLPHNLEQQLERHVAPIQTILGLLAFVFACIVVAQFAGVKALATANTMVVVGVFFIVAALMGVVQWAKHKKALRSSLPVALLVPLFAVVVCYRNGYLPLTFAMPVTLLTLLAYRGRYRLLVPYLFVAAWAIAEHFSPVQAAEPYVLRLIMVNAVIIYPLHLLLEAEEWNQALLEKVFQNVLIQGILVSIILTFLRMFVEQQGVASNAIGTITLFSMLYFTISRGWLSGARVKLIFSLALLAIYWFMVAKNGLQLTMFIVGFALFYFLLLPAFDALMLSVALLVVSLLGIYNAPSIDFEITPFVSRYVVASLISMVVLYSLFKRREEANSLSFRAITKGLPIALGITIGIILLELPVFQTISFDSTINETQMRMMVGMFVMFILITWITSRYWYNHENLQSILNNLSATEQELAASLRQARKQTQQMELMAKGGGVGFFECDLTGGTLRGNATLMARMNLPEDAVISMAQVVQNVPEAAREAFQQDLKATTEAGPGAIKTFTHPYVTASGELASYRVIATTEMRGEKLMALGASIDITDELDAKDKAEHAAQVLAVEQDRQKQMFAVISHEIRTPAASLNMLIHNKGITCQDPADAEKIEELSDHLLVVLNDLRSVIKPEQIKAADDRAVKVFVTVEKIATSLSVLLEQNGQVIKTKTVGEMPTVLKFNVQLVRQILTNLVKNASVHSACSEITLKISAIRKDEKHWLTSIQVEDNGRGISPADQEKMFTAFARGSTQADGTGLGLYIAREYANQLGGDLTYRLREEGGSVFELTFMAEEAVQYEQPLEQEVATKTIEGIHILLAEDNEVIRRVTEIIINKGGATVDMANDGIEALALLKENPDKYDLVITDIMMPNMNGYQLTRELREFGCSTPIIGVTAAVIGEESAQLLEAGADQVIEKPVDLPKLNAAYVACIQNADDDDSAEQGT